MKHGPAPADDVDAYLARVPEPARSAMNRMRAIIRSAVPPEATEAIAYRMPAFRYHGPLVAYAAFRNHCSFYPMNGTLIEAFQDELKGFQTAKGTVRFPLDKPLPAALIKKLVRARVAENEHRKHGR